MNCPFLPEQIKNYLFQAITHNYNLNYLYSYAYY